MAHAGRVGPVLYFSSRRRHTRCLSDWSSDVCSSDLQNLLILGNEQDDVKFVKESKESGKSFITAVDAKSGKTAWQTPRNSAVVSYATPCIFPAPTTSKTAAGKHPAIIFHSQGHGIYAVDPKGGKVLWEFGSAFDKRTVSSPLLAGDLILGSCGSGGGGNYVMAVRPPTSAAGGSD